MFSKEEHLAAFTLRVGSRIQARVGMRTDGAITAIQGTWYVDTGYYSFTTQAQVAVGSGELMIMAQCPNWDLKNMVVTTNRNASGSTRGFGGQELKCSFIPLLCLAMQKAGLDPFEVLKKNYVKPGGGYFWRDGHWYQYRGMDYSQAMDQGAERFGWKEKWKGWLTPTATWGTKRTGIGVGVHGNADVGEDVAEAYVQLGPNGTATIFLCVAEHGTGQKSNYVRMVAEVLQIPPERIAMTPADSLVTPFEFGPVGSRGTYAIGSAVIKAAEDAREKLLAFAASKLEVDPQDLDTADGVVFVTGHPEKKLKWRAFGNDRTILGYGRFEPDFTVCNCMMSFVEVEVDTETGAVALSRVVLATDVGQIMDPQGLEGQLNLRKGGPSCPALAGDHRYHSIFGPARTVAPSVAPGLGGKGCFAVSPSDLAVVLVALDARILTSKRNLSASRFFEATATRSTVLEPNEMIKEIRIPRPPAGARQNYKKFTLRKPIDFAVVSVASILALDRGVCTDARIVLGGVAPQPWRAWKAEEAIKGRILAEEVAAEAARQAVAEARPLKMNAYKVENAKALVKQAIWTSPPADARKD